MSSVMFVPILGLAGTAVFCTIVALLIARRLGRFLNFRTLGILNFVVANLISGVVHLSRLPQVSRGYYDLTTGSHPPIDTVLFGSCFAGVILALTCMRHLPKKAAPKDPVPWLLPSESKLLFTAAIVMLPLALNASAIVRSYAGASGQARIIGLDNGLARYSFMSGWFVWVVSFLAIWLTAKIDRSAIATTLVAGVAAVAIAWSLSWNGGRSIVLVMALPIILVLLPRLRGMRYLAIPGGIAAVTYLGLTITTHRSLSQSYDQTSLGSMLDWQWGRFSMLGFAAEYVDQHGLMWGETFLAGIEEIIVGILRFAHLGPGTSGLETSTHVTGSALLGSSDVTYIVPGLSAELWLNFGIVGLLVGYYVLGRLLNWVDRRFTEASGAILQLTWAYVGTLLVFRTITGDSGAFWAYLTYSGVPVLLVAAVSWHTRRRRSPGPVVGGRAGREHQGTHGVDHVAGVPLGA